MSLKSEEQKKRNIFSNKPIVNLLLGLGFFTIILLAAMMSYSNNNQQNSLNANLSGNNQGEQATNQGDSILAVVKAIDTDRNTITLFDVNSQASLELSYNGGTNITDKYDKPILMSSISLGEMVDAVYRQDQKKLTAMNISKKAWCYEGVNNFEIDMDHNTMKIAKTLYKYENNISILNGDEFIQVNQLAQQDELTVWGNDETIWSIIVDKGHGVVILQDYEEYIGDFITVGYEAMQQIKENMEIPVREGNFNLTVENGDYSATKNITVYRNKETYVSLADLGPEASKLGMVTFEITPFGADLYIDGELHSYANPIELEYGEHKLKVSMGGYTSYQGKLEVGSTSKTVNVDLPKTGSNEKANVSESQNSNSGTSSNSTGNSASNSSGGNQSGSTGTNNTTGNSSGSTSGNTSGSTNNSSSGKNSNQATDNKHQIYVQNPSGASVYIDGDFKCTAPGNFPKILGTHVITFIRDGYKTMSYTIEVANDGLDSYYTFPDLVKN